MPPRPLMPPCPLQATLTRLLDHLSLVASFHDFNRMNAQNIAVCFGPVLLTQNQELRHPSTGTRGYGHSEDIASAVDFKRHIEVLHYLLQAWPGEQGWGGTCTPPLWGCPLHSHQRWGQRRCCCDPPPHSQGLY